MAKPLWLLNRNSISLNNDHRYLTNVKWEAVA